jgi:hypothetical protein
MSRREPGAVSVGHADRRGANPKVVEISYASHSANARNAASDISPAYRRRTKARRRSLRLRFDGIDEAILIR